MKSVVTMRRLVAVPLMFAGAVTACAPPGPQPKEGSPVLFPSVPPEEDAADPVSNEAAGMPVWLSGKLYENRVPWADNTYREVPDPRHVPQVAITPEEILLDGAVVASVPAAVRQSRKEFFGPMFDGLVNEREAWKKANPCQPFHGQVAFWIDERVRGWLLSSTVKAAAFAGFPNLHLMVRDRGGAGFRTMPLSYLEVLRSSAPAFLQERVEILERLHGEFQKCSERVTGGAGKLRGSLNAHFVVNADGGVGNIRFDCDTVSDARVRECVAKVLSKVRFPLPVLPPRNMSHTVQFEPE